MGTLVLQRYHGDPSYLGRAAKGPVLMTRILLYTTEWCGYCRAAKQLLRTKGHVFEEIMVDADPPKRAEMIDRAGGVRTVPQIFIDGSHVGGYTELAELNRQGRLDAWLASEPEVVETE